MTDKKNQLAKIQSFLDGDEIKKKFENLLKDRASIFLSTVLQVVAQDSKLAKADHVSIYLASLASATLGLSIDPNFGQAYIIPYNVKKKDENGKEYKTVQAQFQLGYKGYETLAIRSGKYKHMIAKLVYEGQLVEDGSFLGYHFDRSAKTSDKVIGFASYFKLHDGFEDTKYMTVEEIKAHAKEYSQTFKKWGSGQRKDNFEKMGLKTVIKLHLNSGKAPMDPLMELAIKADQGFAKDDSLENFDYDDNPTDLDAKSELSPDVVEYRQEMLSDCESTDHVDALMDQNKVTDPQILDLFQNRKDEINNQSK